MKTKAFLLFLSGALLGSAAAWFLWLGQLRPDGGAPQAAAPSPPKSVPAAPVLVETTTRTDATVAAVGATIETPATTDANASVAPVDSAHEAVLPPETTPTAPIAAPSDALAPPPAALPPMRNLALLIPVEGVKPTQLSDNFTEARSEGRSHEAIDIMAPLGTPVRAVEDGTIEKLFESKQGGLTIYQFDRAGEITYYYAHLDRYAPGLTDKQAVKQGDVIGYVGYTGNANPAAPHLHFAIFRLGPEKKWWKGTPVNPYPYLRGP
jgi:murein DD-endopeptidase MepM/ murein hydrolase activator NlpD